MNYLEKMYEIMGEAAADNFWDNFLMDMYGGGSKSIFDDDDDKTWELENLYISQLVSIFGWGATARLLEEKVMEWEDEHSRNFLTEIADEMLVDGVRGTWGYSSNSERLSDEVNEEYILVFNLKKMPLLISEKDINSEVYGELESRKEEGADD